eukprot:5365180-Pyramimonas_sp.AAC.1
MPQWCESWRRRRGPAAPRVELVIWVRILPRRVGSQLWRELRFDFALSSVLLKSAVNFVRSVRLADHRKNGQTPRQYSQ